MSCPDDGHYDADKSRCLDKFCSCRDGPETMTPMSPQPRPLPPSGASPISARQAWLRVLALAPAEALERAWQGLPERPAHAVLRAPEVGSALVRGRAGGRGAPFNLGEMTVTRCAVTVGRHTGIGYVAGRHRRKAELVALFDALLQDDARRPALQSAVLAPLAEAHAATVATRSSKAAASRVDFFTLVRGED